MNPKSINTSKITDKESNSVRSELQKLYCERIERFMALVELSYALKRSPRIIQKK